MSQIMTIRRFGFVLLIGFAALIGCGTPNDKAPLDPETGTHPAGWVVSQHVAASTTDGSSCTECHGGYGNISGVVCSDCHRLGDPFVMKNCTSCHGKPPVGATAPNRMGAHWTHNGLSSNVTMCDSCHSGAGTDTVTHYNGTIDVKLLSVYNAKSGTAARNADGTCSSVSCHGGQKTPAWLSGTTIDVNTQCTSCHAYGSGEYNSFISGRHNTHVNDYGFACTRCHDTTLLQTEHFTRLDTPAGEGFAANTMDSSLSYLNGTCLPACHNRRPW
ncbi:MAG: CxxxxCH/CxxCH domain c-type cytochrome [Nitrospirota bacterium]